MAEAQFGALPRPVHHGQQRMKKRNLDYETSHECIDDLHRCSRFGAAVLRPAQASYQQTMGLDTQVVNIHRRKGAMCPAWIVSPSLRRRHSVEPME